MSEKWLKPRVLRMTNRSSVVARSDFDIVKQDRDDIKDKLHEERESRIRLESINNDLSREMDDVNSAMGEIQARNVELEQRETSHQEFRRSHNTLSEKYEANVNELRHMTNRLERLNESVKARKDSQLRLLENLPIDQRIDFILNELGIISTLLKMAKIRDFVNEKTKSRRLILFGKWPELVYMEDFGLVETSTVVDDFVHLNFTDLGEKVFRKLGVL